LECNFSAPTEDKPALMTHDEVETFFHEFGHVLHSLLSRSELGTQSGFFVSQDFVEAPSQIFENWVWNFESLSLFAKHYKTGEKLPKELFDKMLAAKTVMSGRETLYQIFLGNLDMTLYGGYDVSNPESIITLQQKLDKEINLTEPFADSRMAAAFGHLNGYGASYYGYLWSKVFAQDMFSRFEEEGIFSKDAGLDYKNLILAQGASKDEMVMLREYLGRDPQKDAFIRSLGLKDPS
jgi:thimet oligopeptidase